MSQNTRATIVPIDSATFYGHLRAIIKDNENGKVAMRELQLTKNSLDTAKLSINLKDSALDVMKQRDTARINQLVSYSKVIDLLKEQNQVSINQVGFINKERLKQKRLKIVFQITTVLAALASGYFAIIK